MKKTLAQETRFLDYRQTKLNAILLETGFLH